MPPRSPSLLRTEYDPASDVMWLTGQTADNPITGGEWGTAGTVVARYDDWSKGPKAPAVSGRPAVQSRASVSWCRFCVAGDLFFTVDCKSARVFVYDKKSGRHLGTLSPGPEVHRESGWVDFRDALRATRLDDGSYLIFAEEDFKAKILVYHLQDPLRKASRLATADIVGNRATLRRQSSSGSCDCIDRHRTFQRSSAETENACASLIRASLTVDSSCATGSDSSSSTAALGSRQALAMMTLDVSSLACGSFARTDLMNESIGSNSNAAT